MTALGVKAQITSDMKVAMKAKQTQRLGVIRLILSAIKQREVDERIVLEDAQVVGILNKMCKQGKGAMAQFRSAGRDDLADKEQYELSVLESYLPQVLSEQESDALIQAAIASIGAQGLQDMGKVMAAVKTAAAGRADMALVSQKVKQFLDG
jgi:uncharacterized protein YqeY